MKAVLVLENGKVFTGEAMGYAGETAGEVVFNTGMSGYQEVITDPSYTGQIVVMTYPLIGNYGVNDEDVESAKPQIGGMVVKHHSSDPSNWRSQDTLNNYLTRHKIVGIAGVDTRALTLAIRSSGTMGGVITCGDEPLEVLVEKAKKAILGGPEIVASVTTPKSYQIAGDGPKVVVLDLGVKQNIIRQLKASGFDLVIMPSHTSAEEIMLEKPDGLFLSNGPGDPKDVPDAIKTVKELMGKVPMFGICLGHQIMGLALGANTYKLKFGHRGSNHPVQDLRTGKVCITSQNHGYAVDWSSIQGTEVVVTHKNLNDDTVEGIVHRGYKAFSVQYHPEAYPGPEDSRYLFDEFLDLMK
ncbi:carbamoyl-phosphate synthase small subunit [Desulfitispora alkaliphila]|uniref:glutamine-hydrolyzing carbamoyl-phosphate synthase small subunit n=1 Tax=Desulfitispora alkaliphila TaxID=622674 RepID=UPI003D246923